MSVSCQRIEQVADKNWAGFTLPGWILALTADGVEFCIACGATNVDFTAGGRLVLDGMWHHVLVVRVVCHGMCCGQ